ncbi:C-X-C motif chemokine 13 [Petaurus breviceps papuanus]|uniref:C-X-C motif chemokine 13 n=1 Tax=Petaurus breviceps papuanus TaxID=3040969 RepID=UPI0036DB935A
MKSTAASVIVVLLMVINISLVQGILETNDASHKCKCVKMLESIPLQVVKTISLSPPNGGCRNAECIVTVKSGAKVCVNCKWLENILQKIKRNKATTPNVKVERQRKDSK